MNRSIAALLGLVILTGCEPAQEGTPAPATATSDSLAPLPSAPPAAAMPATPDSRGVILFIGTSLTAGYGLGASLAYPALIQQKLDSLRLPYRAVNAGISGETSAGGLRRIDWSLQQPVSVLVLELGANDGLRGLDVDSMKHNLDGIVRRTRERYPKATIVIAGMEAPPNLGSAYTRRFHNVFGELADQYNAVLIPFLLEGVAAQRSLNQEDGMHPTAEGQRIIAETVWKYLRPVL